MLKPLHGCQGNFIFKANNINEFEIALTTIFSQKDDVVVQEYVDADEFRIVLLDGEIVQAYQRFHSCIKGDGINNVYQLINFKNLYFSKRGRNTVIDTNDKQIDSILKGKGYTLESVLSTDEVLNLSYGRNLSKGGEYRFLYGHEIEVFRDVLQAMALQTGLRLVGFDIFVKTTKSFSKNDVVFIEYNASPDMENNFYYDGNYSEVLEEIYKKIFEAMIK
jgi:glutathione synthase/RimK-type ligase-like ATP-grasp enzyme